MKKVRKHILMVLVLLAVLLSGCANTSDSGPGTEDEAPQEAEPSTMQLEFEGTDLEGNSVSASILSQSKLTMINVWATDCNPCLSEMPDLGELAAEYDAEDFQLIGIVSDVLEGEDQTLVESLIEQTGANYTHLLLNESIYYALLTDVRAVPTTFFLDQEGTVLSTVVGAKKKSVWEAKIDALLEEQ